MDRKTLQALADNFSDEAPENYIKAGQEGGEDYIGYRLYQKPIFSIGSADDPLFAKLLNPEVIGPHHKMPDFWLDNPKTIISFFSPTSEEVKKANIPEPVKVAVPWLFARVEGQEYLKAMIAHLCAALNAEGIRTAAPLADDRFILNVGFPDNPHVPPYSSNWSERHAAFICGLGTFSLSYNIITEKGTCGRFFSIISDWDIAPDSRPYSDLFEYCSKCGLCIKRCPGNVISFDAKDVPGCSTFMANTGKANLPRYGCGKCQVDIPCESRIPSVAALS